jgi:hypothetical protein
VQIIPAVGWVSYHLCEDIDGKTAELFSTPLAAWGLTCDGTVVALEPDTDGQLMVPMEFSSSWLGVFAIGKKPTDGQIEAKRKYQLTDHAKRAEDTSGDLVMNLAMALLDNVRLSDAEAEDACAAVVIDHCHYWGNFYGPASSPFLARVLAHRFLDRQGYNAEHLRAALITYGKKAGA